MELNSWILSDRKKFLPFLDKFGDEVNIQHRSNLKRWDENKNLMVEDSPLIHQKFVSDFMNDNTPYRGLLLYHGLGSGKSGASIMIAEGFKGKQIVILTPKSLRKNYEDEIKRFGDISYKKQYFWCFIEITLSNNKGQNKNIYNKFKNQGIPNYLLKKILKKYGGIWMIDLSKEPNYNGLSDTNKSNIDEQVEILYNYRYTFIHYNMGSSLLTHIFKTFYKNYISMKESIYGSNMTDSNINKTENKKLKIRLLQHIYNPDNNIENPFSNKVIIIDEVHNLTSMMAGGGFNGPFLYEMLMRAENCKIILLSGTPVINYAYELGLLFNILRGYIKTYTIKLKKTDGSEWNSDNIRSILNSTKLVDRIKIDSEKELVTITRNPYGFITDFDLNGNNIGVVKNDINNINNNDFIDIILNILGEGDYMKVGDINKYNYNLFPDILNQNSNNYTYLTYNSAKREESEEIFNSQYIDYDNFSIIEKSILLFQSKILGLVSFYNEISGVDELTGSNFFPELIYANNDETDVYMSDYQFSLYTASRDIERELDDARKGQNQSKEISFQIKNKTPNLFRVFSRQSSLFVFPPNIKRPKMKEYRFIKYEKEFNKTDKVELYKLLKNICKSNDIEREQLISELKDILETNININKIWTNEISIKELDEEEKINDYDEYLKTSIDIIVKHVNY